MPGNTVKINNFKGLEYYVGDSKMDGLIQYLNKHGVKNKDHSMIESIILCNKCIMPLQPTGGESNTDQDGFTEHFYCEKCDVEMNVSVNYHKEKNVKAEAIEQ